MRDSRTPSQHEYNMISETYVYSIEHSKMKEKEL